MKQLDDSGDRGRPLITAGFIARATMRLFDDRADAGRQLAGRLKSLRGQDIVVLGPALQAPLDVLVRKLGVPFQPELAFGAIGEGGVRVIDQRLGGE